MADNTAVSPHDIPEAKAEAKQEGKPAKRRKAGNNTPGTTLESGPATASSSVSTPTASSSRLDSIVIKGAAEHNLKNIDIELPRNKLIVITGVSGSGKSSLAFDTLYAEGQRRYVESLSAYARQFLGQMRKPDVEYIEGLSPAISIDQKARSHNPRSTVGTQTEVYDYLRLLFARVGKPHCYSCGRPVSRQSAEQIADSIYSLGIHSADPPLAKEAEEEPDASPEPGEASVPGVGVEVPKAKAKAKPLGGGSGPELLILAPVVLDRKGEHHRVVEHLRKLGFSRVRVDGIILGPDDPVERLDKYKRHTVEAVVDRLTLGAESDEAARELRSRFTEDVETALEIGEGLLRVLVQHGGNESKGEEATEPRLYSEHFACPHCSISFEQLQPRNFSFNSPHGACSRCDGLGQLKEIDPGRIITDPQRSINGGAIEPWANSNSYIMDSMCRALAAHYDFSLGTPWRELPQRVQEIILHGSGTEHVPMVFEGSRMSHRVNRPFEGVIPMLERRYRETDSEYMRQEYDAYMSNVPCPECLGSRLRPEARSVTFGGRAIHELTGLTVKRALAFIEGLDLAQRDRLIAHGVLKEIKARLSFMAEVGLDYLTLDRTSGTLSGGESQRIRLATQIGSGLVGVMYILDEPSIGLHQRDNLRLIRMLQRLRDLGNTLIVVEHDEQMMLEADQLVDLGPGAGIHGGEVVAQGPPGLVMIEPASLTGQYLRGKLNIPLPEGRREGSGEVLVVTGAEANNLRRLRVEFPLGKFICVTGVSGSGKSSLVDEILFKALARHFHNSKENPGPHTATHGMEHLDKVIIIDQNPIGRTPRSNPTTYIGAFGPIRDLYARTDEARLRGYKPGRFSFNVKGGRCETCQGGGLLKIEMNFLPDVYIPCEQCKARRYNRETLEVHFKGNTIYDVLEMTVEEAVEFFAAHRAIHRKLSTLNDVGLGYIRLGQPATTLSGGEAQRVKLAAELSKVATGRTLYLLDEPTTGLHFEDIKKLLTVLGRLVDAGNTIVIIEHNLDVIKTADHVIDLGPEGGDEGGELVAQGTPEQVAADPASYTGQYLSRILPSLEPKPVIPWVEPKRNGLRGGHGKGTGGTRRGRGRPRKTG